METSLQPIVVRATSPSDQEALAEFIQPFVDSNWLLPRTTDELDELVRTGFVAVHGEQIVGCAALEIYSRKLAEVRSLAVAPAYQGQGIGKRLVEACLDLARERQILEVMAITSTESFFRACGFDYTLPGEKKALFIQTREKH